MWRLRPKSLLGRHVKSFNDILGITSSIQQETNISLSYSFLSLHNQFTLIILIK